MTRSVICVSHQTGADGPAVAAELADRLGYRYVDEEVIVSAARREGLTVEALADVEKRKSFFGRIMDEFGRSQVGMLGVYGIPVDALEQMAEPDKLRVLIRQSIEEIAAEGNVVMVSHAASYALTGREDALRVFIVGTPDRRVANVAAANDLDEGAARKSVAAHDTARADYLKRFYDVAKERPSDYDVVVNTDRLSSSEAVDVIAAAAG
jgi:cytidylate kinase